MRLTYLYISRFGSWSILISLRDPSTNLSWATHQHKAEKNQKNPNVNHERHEWENKRKTKSERVTAQLCTAPDVVSYCVSVATTLLICGNCCHGNKVTGMLRCQKGFILEWHRFQCYMCTCVCYTEFSFYHLRKKCFHLKMICKSGQYF